MTIFAFEAQESWLPTVIDMTCSAVELDEDAGLLALLFGDVREISEDELDAERAITMTGVWRIEQGDAVIAASGDAQDDERQEQAARLVGKRLVQVDVSHPGFDLALHLTDGLTVRCFPCDSLQYGEDPPENEDIFVSWWVDGAGVPDDWEEPNPAFFEQ